MQKLYAFASGPLAWAAFGVFILGSLYRLWSMYRLARQKDVSSVAYMNAGFGFRSILAWLTPFKALGWRQNPGVCATTFVFHLCLVVVALFYSAHAVLWEYAFDVRLPSLPDGVADLMTILVVAGAAVFALRRLSQPLSRFITQPMDWLALVLAAAPFVTGFLARHQWGDYPTMAFLHVLSGDLMLMAIPFTRLSHALFSPFTRAYMGSEFGGVRRCADW